MPSQSQGRPCGDGSDGSDADRLIADLLRRVFSDEDPEQICSDFYYAILAIREDARGGDMNRQGIGTNNPSSPPLCLPIGRFFFAG